MNPVKPFLATILLALLAGCKITQIVPPGGSIVSSSGAHDCAAGQTCFIHIDGVAFSDTFTAEPAPGYTFRGWQGALCGGTTTPCELQDIPPAWTAMDIEAFLLPAFEIELLDLLPAATGGVFQVYPQQDGALDLSAASADWTMAPPQLVQRYSAGMDIAGHASRLLLAQLADTPQQFLLLALLESADVDTLLAGVSSTPAGSYQGFALYDLGGSGLRLARLDSRTLVVGDASALQRSLDVHAGSAPSIAAGPLGSYLHGLDLGEPNSAVYGLPGLYAAVAAPGDGDASLSQARVFSTAFAVDGADLDGALLFYTDNAASYAAALQDALAGYPAPDVLAAAGILAVDLGGLSAQTDVLPLLKALLVDMDAIDYAGAVAHGGNPPWMNFEVGGDPPAVFINFEFAGAAQIAAFEAAHLPPGFTLQPYRMLASDTPRYMMVLNIYQSSGGLVQGARAEWSVFVNDPDTGQPRFMVVEAKAESLSADSVNLLTFGEPVSYVEENGSLNAYVGYVDPLTQIETTYFSASIPWPQPPSSYEPFERGFMTANDYVFWGNAVADRILYNSSAHNRDAAKIPAAGFTFSDNSAWSAYLAPEPLHTAVYLNQQDIVISPWWNLDAAYLDVTPQYLQTLIDFKNGFYPGTVQNLARDAIRGEGIALRAAQVSASVPSAYYHFPLLDAAGLLTLAAGPGVHAPAAVELFADEAAAHYLTLAVYAREDDPCGVRAEWITYVQGADGYADSLRLDALSAQACLDPLVMLAPAAQVEQSVSADLLSTRVETPFVRFAATTDLGLAELQLPGQNWLEAGEWVCSLNGVCDSFYYDGQLLGVPEERAGAAATQVTLMQTPWDAYIDVAGARATVRRNPALQVFNPWRNQATFAADGATP
ncbi:MAG: hypothetical protein CME59_10920 [Halioglobus sp.]|nr:hypothetical protein [Halioglobus sp.]